MSLVVDIYKKYAGFELDIQLDTPSGVTALLGNSGSGKSLTLRCIAGIETPDSGRIVINGRTVFDSQQGINLPPQQRGVGYLFQQYALFAHMTVTGNIGCVIKAPKTDKQHRISELLATFQLTDVAMLYPKQLSGGQQQRVALARMLATNPLLMLLDEPLSALDQMLKASVEQTLRQTAEAFLGTTLLVTHDPGEAYRMSQQVAILHQGRVDSHGDTAQVFSHPKTQIAAQLTGYVNRCDQNLKVLSQ